MAVRACTMAPSAKIGWFMGEVCSATKSFMISDPDEVGLPAMKLSSLIATGNPSSRPCGAPLAQRASDARAASSASSKWVKVKALTVSFVASARAIWASSNSTGDSDLSAKRASASVAVR